MQDGSAQSGCPVPGGAQRQVGQGAGQPDLMGGKTTVGGWKRMNFKVPFQPKPFSG